MSRTKRKGLYLFSKEEARLRARIKRAVLKLVRANPDKLVTGYLVGAVRRQSKIDGDTNTLLFLEGFIAGVIWSMKDCGELVKLPNRCFVLGPRAPKLRKR